MSVYEKDEKITYGYVPANMPGGPTMNNSMYDNKILGWWNDKCIIQYPKLLISAYHTLKAKKTLKTDNLANFFNIDKDMFLIMDSGGFSMSTLGEISITPQQVIDLSIEFNANIMMSLDIPPYNLIDNTRPFRVDEQEFIEKMEKSYQNAKYQSENKKNFKGKYYICIHGDSLERLEKWWKKHEHLDFDGVALAPKNKSDYWELARTLAWIYSKGIKENIHFLAFSGMMTIPVLVYFSKYIKNLTYDSSSWAGGAMRRELCLPLLKQKIIYGTSTNFSKLKFPAMNDFTKQLKSMNDFNHPQNGGVLLSLYNLKEYENFDRLLYSLVEEDDIFKEFVRVYLNPKLLEVFDYIDFAITHGYEVADKKYGNKFTTYNQSKQQTIFEF